MKTAAIIAEYNPFHEGHQYHIAQTRQNAGADFVLAVISGDFVQRGAPAIYNKYDRTQTALKNGVDVVLELPVRYALSSAADFAAGGVSLCEQLGCIDLLSFGSESGDISLLQQLASLELRAEKDPVYQGLIHTALKNGSSYPAARANALCTWSSSEAVLPEKELAGLLLAPNNILALEYCRALLVCDSQIRPFTVKRKGAYHDCAIHRDADIYPSASAIRQALLSSDNAACLLETEDFSSLLHYKLLSQRSAGFAGYLDCSEDLSDKILKFLPEYRGFSDFCEKLKSRDLTYSRISRVLTHILLDIKKDELTYKPVEIPYARLLGFRQDAQPLLAQFKQNASIPLLSKMADADALLTPSGRQLLAEDVLASEIYETIRFHKTGTLPVNEYRQSPIVYRTI